MPFIRAKYKATYFPDGRKFAPGGKGRQVTDAELAALYATKVGAVEVGRINFETALEVLDDKGNVMPYPPSAPPAEEPSE